MKKNRTKASRDANIRLPETVTDNLIKDIQNLPDDAGFKHQYLKEVFLEKYVSKDTAPAPVRKERAIFKWLCTEMNNAATNDRLLITLPDYQILPGVTFESFVEKAVEIAERVLGPVPEFDAIIGSFSGGATTSRKRTESHPAQKYLGQADITKDCIPLFHEVIEELPGWNQFWDQLQLRLMPGNVLFTVPKNADIDRVACKEPDINMYIQKGLGAAIRRALKLNGIDLNDQSINQSLARKGSIDGSLATLDLSSASDSIAYGLVELIIPPIWFTWLNMSRSKVTLIQREDYTEVHKNEMFSSMGNGFTFELESLLFYVLARTVAYFEGIRGIISVYGDDIIVPTSLAQDLIWVLEFFGFTVNTKKSFLDGPFRESCGGHFINGCDVTPFYLKGPLERLTDLIHAVNLLRKWSETTVGINDEFVYPIWLKYCSMVPKSLWGGREYSSKLQVVSPHGPRGRLVPSKVVTEHGVGGYIHWLNSTWRRTSMGSIERRVTPSKMKPSVVYTPGEAVVTSSSQAVIHKYRIRPANCTGTKLNNYFLEEITVEPSSIQDL